MVFAASLTCNGIEDFAREIERSRDWNCPIKRRIKFKRSFEFDGVKILRYRCSSKEYLTSIESHSEFFGRKIHIIDASQLRLSIFLIKSYLCASFSNISINTYTFIFHVLYTQTCIIRTQIEHFAIRLNENFVTSFDFHRKSVIF